MRLLESLLPWFFPGVTISLVVGLVTSGVVGRSLGVSRIVALALILSLGIILSATLTPLRWAIDFGAAGTGACNFSRIGLAPLGELLRFDDTSLNVLLFIPLGVTIGLVPRSRRKAAIVAAAIALPFAIETVQLLVPWLDRGCESADVVDNLTGLFVGLAAGSVAGRAAAPWRGTSHGGGASRPD